MPKNDSNQISGAHFQLAEDATSKEIRLEITMFSARIG